MAEARGGTPKNPEMVTPELLRGWPLPVPGGSKYARGLVLAIGGARATPGAVMLAGRAALRMGAGRLSLAVADSVCAHVAVAVPECGAYGLAEDSEGSITGRRAAEVLTKELSRADAVLIGPGLDDPAGAAALLTELIPALPKKTPVLLDAFGATVLPDLDEALVDALRGRLVLTPNSAEMGHLLGRPETNEDDTEVAPEMVVDCAKRFGAVVGCDAYVAEGGRMWRSTTGDVGLGTSGSGDVMAGVVLGLLGRGADLAQAVVWGKYVHQAAGDALVGDHGRIGFLASEIETRLPRVLRTLGGD